MTLLDSRFEQRAHTQDYPLYNGHAEPSNLKWPSMPLCPNRLTAIGVARGEDKRFKMSSQRQFPDNLDDEVLRNLAWVIHEQDNRPFHEVLRSVRRIMVTLP